ncbi:MAG: hydroxymethylglutaryl-CoA lyase [Pseudomonadota bacterium]
MVEHVTIFEVSPRDGLQNEQNLISAQDKIELVDKLSDCRFAKIEVTSFVSPKWVPQMADATEVMAGINRKSGVSYAALTPNLRGFEAAVAAKCDEVAVFASASEGFSQKNINCSIDESLARFEPVIEAGQSADIPVRGYVSCVTDCPYDGPTPPEQVARVSGALIDMGCYQVSLGDTIGAATPDSAKVMLGVVADQVPAVLLAGHFHDTKGRALDNIEVCLEFGMRVFDASVAGLGGCPYAPGAKGNVATESVVKMLHDRGYETGIDLSRLDDASLFANTLRSQP